MMSDLLSRPLLSLLETQPLPAVLDAMTSFYEDRRLEVSDPRRAEAFGANERCLKSMRQILGECDLFGI